MVTKKRLVAIVIMAVTKIGLLVGADQQIDIKHSTQNKEFQRRPERVSLDKSFSNITLKKPSKSKQKPCDDLRDFWKTIESNQDEIKYTANLSTTYKKGLIPQIQSTVNGLLKNPHEKQKELHAIHVALTLLTKGKKNRNNQLLHRLAVRSKNKLKELEEELDESQFIVFMSNKVKDVRIPIVKKACLEELISTVRSNSEKKKNTSCRKEIELKELSSFNPSYADLGYTPAVNKEENNVLFSSNDTSIQALISGGKRFDSSEEAPTCILGTSISASFSSSSSSSMYTTVTEPDDNLITDNERTIDVLSSDDEGVEDIQQPLSASAPLPQPTIITEETRSASTPADLQFTPSRSASWFSFILGANNR